MLAAADIDRGSGALVEQVDEERPKAADQDHDREWQENSERRIDPETAAVDAGPFPQVSHHALHNAASITIAASRVITEAMIA